MYKIFFISLCLTSLMLNLFGQCSTTPNYFELQVKSADSKQLVVQIRYNNKDLKQGFLGSRFALDGLVFALSWPSTSSIQIGAVANMMKPFALQVSDASPSAMAKNVEKDNIVTFYHAASMPARFEFELQNGVWYDLVKINYEGILKQGDFFSLLNCDYGLSHPNSYQGNSNTDPWFAMLDEDGTYLQYSPKMVVTHDILEQTHADIRLFPNPLMKLLNIDVESKYETQVAVSICDLEGKIMKTVVYKLQVGKNSTAVDFSSFVSGTYFVKVSDGKNINHMQKIQKL